MTSVQPKFDQVNIVSADPEASLKFYRLLGIEIPEESVWRTQTGIHHASAKATADEQAPGFDIDSSAFAQKWNSGWSGRDDLKGRVVVGFHLPSRNGVDELYGKLTGAGHAGLQAPYDAIWGSRYAIVEDPDGVAVGLMSPVSPELRSPPPQV
jgi:uncharacterized glyoxalase superfamily protein PhnB